MPRRSYVHPSSLSSVKAFWISCMAPGMLALRRLFLNKKSEVLGKSQNQHEFRSSLPTDGGYFQERSFPKPPFQHIAELAPYPFLVRILSESPKIPSDPPHHTQNPLNPEPYSPKPVMLRPTGPPQLKQGELPPPAVLVPRMPSVC